MSTTKTTTLKIAKTFVRLGKKASKEYMKQYASNEVVTSSLTTRYLIQLAHDDGFRTGCMAGFQQGLIKCRRTGQ